MKTIFSPSTASRKIFIWRLWRRRSGTSLGSACGKNFPNKCSTFFRGVPPEGGGGGVRKKFSVNFFPVAPCIMSHGRRRAMYPGHLLAFSVAKGPYDKFSGSKKEEGCRIQQPHSPFWQTPGFRPDILITNGQSPRGALDSMLGERHASAQPTANWFVGSFGPVYRNICWKSHEQQWVSLKQNAVTAETTLHRHDKAPLSHYNRLTGQRASFTTKTVVRKTTCQRGSPCLDKAVLLQGAESTSFCCPHTSVSEKLCHNPSNQRDEKHHRPHNVPCPQPPRSPFPRPHSPSVGAITPRFRCLRRLPQRYP